MLLLNDANILTGYVEAMEDGGLSNRKERQRTKNGKYKSNTSSTPPPLTLKYLCHAWGVTPKYLRKLRKKKVATLGEEKQKSTKRNGCIDSVAQARCCITPKQLYVRDQLKSKTTADVTMAYDSITTQQKRSEYRLEANVSWETESTAVKERYESYAKSKVDTQPTITAAIIDVLKRNPSLGF